jgi:DNA mismatch repair protein MutS
MSRGLRSILFDGVAADVTVAEDDSVDALRDLNIDQVIATLVEGREEYDLGAFFRSPLPSEDAVAYRHEVFRDLADDRVLAIITAFAQAMGEMRRHLAQLEQRYYLLQKQRWLLDGAAVYCAALRALRGGLDGAPLRSRGLQSLRDYVDRHIDGAAFVALAGETAALLDELGAIDYCVTVAGNRVRVTSCADEVDYGAEVDETFARFKQGAVKDYRVAFRDTTEMNHVEGQILGLVAQLNPGPFGRLQDYCRRNAGFADATIVRFDREIQFYLAYQDQMRQLRSAGLEFCYPRVSTTSKEVRARDTFDLALANKLVADAQPVVCNDWELTGHERIFVVTGPNNGGKTTFARTAGQLHYFAALGCPVPGREAQLLLFDKVFTHFEREEDLSTLSGKLEADLMRVHEILTRATDRSLVVMNESFSSTTLADALFLGTRVLEQLIERDLLAVYVTFIDELAELGESIVSMMSTVEADNPAARTFKVVRKPADGLAYAAAIAEKYGLSYQALSERLAA